MRARVGKGWEWTRIMPSQTRPHAVLQLDDGHWQPCYNGGK